jgi:hypothetical protein
MTGVLSTTRLIGKSAQFCGTLIQRLSLTSYARWILNLDYTTPGKMHMKMVEYIQNMMAESHWESLLSDK